MPGMSYLYRGILHQRTPWFMFADWLTPFIRSRWQGISQCVVFLLLLCHVAYFTNSDSQPPTALNSFCNNWTLIAVIGYLITSTICELWVWFFPFGFLCPTWRGFYPLEVINKERTHLISWRSHLLKTFQSPTRTIYWSTERSEAPGRHNKERR